MLEIKITDPQSMSKDDLRKLGTFLFVLAGDTIAQVREQPYVVPDTKPKDAPVNKYAPIEPLFTPEELNKPSQPVATDSTPSEPVIPAAPPTSPPAAPVAAVDDSTFDIDGLPWDGRIHSREKTKNADGTWRRKRGIKPATILEVEAELREAIQKVETGNWQKPAENDLIPETPEAPVVPVAPAAPPTPPAAPVAPVTPAAPPAAPVALAESATPENMSFPQLIQKAQMFISQKKLNRTDLEEIAGILGIQSFALISARPDLIQTANALIDAKIMEQSS